MFKVSAAEKKLLFVFAYYTVFASVTLAYFGVATGDQDNFVAAATEYFICESSGPEEPCPKDYEQYAHPGLAATAYLLLGFIPAVSLIFVIHVRELKQWIRKVRHQDTSDFGQTDSSLERTGTSVRNETVLRSLNVTKELL